MTALAGHIIARNPAGLVKMPRTHAAKTATPMMREVDGSPAASLDLLPDTPLSREAIEGSCAQIE